MVSIWLSCVNYLKSQRQISYFNLGIMIFGLWHPLYGQRSLLLEDVINRVLSGFKRLIFLYILTKMFSSDTSLDFMSSENTLRKTASEKPVALNLKQVFSVFLLVLMTESVYFQVG